MTTSTCSARVAGELLRGRVRRRGGPAGCRVQRPRSRAPCGDCRARRSTASPAIALTHEHGDHACGAARLARRLGVPVLTASGTWDRAESRTWPRPSIARSVSAPRPRSGRSRSRPAPRAMMPRSRWRSWSHARDGTSVGVAYDLGRPTAAVRYLLRNFSAARARGEPRRGCSFGPAATRRSVQRRIAGSGGHLSNRAAAELLVELHHPVSRS